LLKNLTIVALVLVVLLVGLLVRDHMSLPSKTLTIFYTSNLRGQLSPFTTTIGDRQGLKVGGLAFIKGTMNDLLRKYRLNSKHVLLLDTGDALFGSAEGSLTYGEAPFQLMVKTGYDALAVGNMEFEYGLETLRKFAATGQLPLLACNYRDLKAPLGNTFLPGKVIEKEGSKIGVIGLGHELLERNTRRENLLELEITDMKTAVQKTAAVLRNEGADLIILISHHPELDDRRDLPRLFPDVDLIIGDLIAPMYASRQQKPVVCPTPQSRGAGLGLIRIPFANGKWDLEKTLRTTLVVDAGAVSPEPTLVAEISKIEAQVDTLLERVLAHSTGDFKRAYDAESSIGHFVTTCLRQIAGTQIAFQNSGGIKMAFPEGAISLRDLYEMLPFENAIVRVNLFGWQIENLVENSLARKGSFLQSSGLNCTYSSQNPEGFRIIQIADDQGPLEWNKSYSVAVSDFMFENRLNWPELAQGTGMSVVGLMRESLKDHLQSVATVSPTLEADYQDVRDFDQTLSIQALSVELASLSKPVTHHESFDSEFGRLVADALRTETDSDFAFIQQGIIRAEMDTIDSLTPSRLVTEIPGYTGVQTIHLPGNSVKTLIDRAVASGSWCCFSGFSLELNNGVVTKILPWEGEFQPEKWYKIAVPHSFPLVVEGKYDFSAEKPQLLFSDLRRVLLQAVRKCGGQVELRRAVY
jgi:2',3'-cyclic-nucleotide 2'-phosphodiesterase (5'-nucleotidase family)